MYSTTFRKVGGSVMMAIPPALLEALGIQPGDAGTLSVEGGNIIAAPVKRPRRSKYSLSELLDNTEYPLTASEREWIDAPAVGREIV
ncbi:antitoxin [Salmonella enterica]|nr:antitoxin [Salmonella enterica]